MSEFKILEENIKSICEENILSILAYISQHNNEAVSLHEISAFVGISPTTLKEKYLEPLCEREILQKYYLRDETTTYAVNRNKLDENFKILKSILNS